MKPLSILLSFFALTGSTPARADVEPRKITLEEARRLALQQDPRLGAARARVRQAEARLAEAGSFYYPRFFASAQYFRSTANNSPAVTLGVPNQAGPGGPTREPTLDSYNNYYAALTGEVTIYDFGTTRALVDEGRARMGFAHADLRATQSSILLAVDEAYMATLATRAGQQVFEEAEKRARAQLALIEAGVRSGLRARAELARVRADLASVRVAIIRAHGAATLARQALADAIGNEDGAEVDAATEPAAQAVSPRVDGMLALARKRRPEIEGLRAELRILEAQRDAARATYLPRLYASGSFSMRGQNTPPPAQLSPDVYNWTLGAVLSWPFFTGFSTEHQIHAAEARIAEVEDRLKQLDQDISYEVRRIVKGIEVAREAVAASQVQVDAARVALELATERFEKGLGTMVELADAEAGRAAADLGLIQARYDLARREAQLEYASGR